MNPTWPERIAALESAGWSLTELAKAIGLTPQSVSDIKQGRSREPRGMAAVRLHTLHALGAKPGEARIASNDDEGEQAFVKPNIDS